MSLVLEQEMQVRDTAIATRFTEIWGRNTLIGPGLINLNSSLLDSNRIKRISGTLRQIQFALKLIW